MLIEKDEQGNWSVKGLPWEMLHVGGQITEKVYEGLYASLLRLKEYEDAGVNPKEILILAEDSRADMEKGSDASDRDPEQSLWEDDMLESGQEGTYADVCWIEDENEYEECPYYCMGLCGMGIYDRCPCETEKEFGRFYKRSQRESKEE